MPDFHRCNGENCKRKHYCRRYTITLSPLEDIVLNRYFINEEYCLNVEINDIDEVSKEMYSEFVEDVQR